MTRASFSQGAPATAGELPTVDYKDFVNATIVGEIVVGVSACANVRVVTNCSAGAAVVTNVTGKFDF